MALALILLVGAAGLALATGGSWVTLSLLPFQAKWLVAIAVVAQASGSLLSRWTGASGWYAAGLAVSAIAALGFCGRNVQVAGVPLITLGLVSNALVVLVNGAMPVSIEAAARANVGTIAIVSGDDPRHEIAGRNSSLRTISDTIPVPLPWRPEVVSPGDVLIAAGLGELVLLGMRPRNRRASAPDKRAASPSAVALP